MRFPDPSKSKRAFVKIKVLYLLTLLADLRTNAFWG